MCVPNLGIISVAVHALIGRVLVNDDQFFADELGLRMTLGAGNVGVAAGESEMSARVVIEGGRHPALRVVAIAAVGLGVFGEELAVVSIVVAGLTLLWSAFES